MSRLVAWVKNQAIRLAGHLELAADRLDAWAGVPDLDLVGLDVWDGPNGVTRQGAAMSLMDEECLGFVLVQVRGHADEPRLNIAAAVEPDHWPAVAVVLARVAAEAIA